MSSGEDTIVYSIKRYPSIGRCIYCGDTQKPRGEEHIVARALVGNRIIFDDASCRECEKMINEFEQPAMKKIFGPARAKFGLHGKKRKGKKPPTHLSMTVTNANSTVEVITLPVAHYPVWFIGLIMRPPTLVAPPLPGVPHFKLWMRHDKEIPALKRHVDKPALAGQINPLRFAQVLAKIAYGYVVAEYGYGSFLSLVHPLLQGKTDKFEDVVGGDPEVPPGAPAICHLRLFEMKGRLVTYVGADVRLWPMAETPNYRVIVGALRPDFAKGTTHSSDIEILR